MSGVTHARILLNGLVVLDAQGSIGAVFAALRVALADLEVTPTDQLTISMRAL